ncbi:hypothetical protein, partial [Listeria valentina]|uniref:hypothetical protein n=1 Tax=Listeria valentina TaxID=2705293 RepID=UPI0014312BE6
MEENKQEQLRLIDKLLDPNLPTEEAKKLRALLRQKEKERTEARGLVYIYSSTSGRNESINLTKDLYFQFRKKGKVDQEIAQIIGFSASAVSKWKKRNG